MKRLLRTPVRIIRKWLGRFTPPPLRILLEFYIRITYGYRQYAGLIQKYDAAPLWLQYYKGTGDVYLSAAYLKYRNGIDQQTGEKHEKGIFVVNGTAARRIAELFQTDGIRIVVLNETKARSLLWLVRFLGNEWLRLNILHYVDNVPMYTNFLIFLAGWNGMGFMDLYRAAVFKNENVILPEPEWDRDKKWTEDFFREHALCIGRTVLIAPLASSIAEGPGGGFWERLAAALSENGYRVCTNLSYRGAKPIPGTEGAFIPYGQLYSFLSLGGFFIGYRSGLCDLTASVPCRKVILYPPDSWPALDGLGLGSTIDIFSLKKMGFAQDVVELEYQKGKEEQTISGIIRTLAQT